MRITEHDSLGPGENYTCDKCKEPYTIYNRKNDFTYQCQCEHKKHFSINENKELKK